MNKTLGALALLTSVSATSVDAQVTRTGIEVDRQNREAAAQMVATNLFADEVVARVHSALDRYEAEGLNQRFHHELQTAQALGIEIPDRVIRYADISFHGEVTPALIPDESRAIPREAIDISIEGVSRILREARPESRERRVERFFLTEGAELNELETISRNNSILVLSHILPDIEVITPEILYQAVKVSLVWASVYQGEDINLCSEAFLEYRQLLGLDTGPYLISTNKMNRTYTTPDVAETLLRFPVIPGANFNPRDIRAEELDCVARREDLPAIAGLARINERERQVQTHRAAQEQEVQEIIERWRDFVMYATIGVQLGLEVGEAMEPRVLHSAANGLYNYISNEVIFRNLTPFYQEESRKVWEMYRTRYPEVAAQILQNVPDSALRY